MTATTTRGPGRPRDVELDQRLLSAAARVYARSGWAGFNFDAVAREAGAGRPALYRRWSSKHELLIAALRSRDQRLAIPDEGSIRDQLVELAMAVFDFYIDGDGMVGIRLLLERNETEEVWREWSVITNARIAAAREIVIRGTARGELRPDTSPSKLLNAINGAMLSFVLTTRGRGPVDLDARRVSEDIVDFVLFDAPGLTPSHLQVNAQLQRNAETAQKTDGRL